MWSPGLLKSMIDPNYVVYTDDLIVIIRDMYPKARYHYLVMPQKDIPDLSKLQMDDVDLLTYMEKKGRIVATEQSADSTFLFGYHSRPSMHRLHLHVISNDLDSPTMKTKRHWNSFTTDFFISSEKLIDDLQSHGAVTIPSTEDCATMMSKPLKCHMCEFSPSNMPKLKEHIKSHFPLN